MPATDAYGNPGFVATDEIIEEAWGDAVALRVVRHYPDYAAWNAANPAPGDGEAYTIGSDLFIGRGGRIAGVAPMLVDPVVVAGNNLAGGGATSQVPGVLNLPTGPFDVDYLVMWSGVGSNAAAVGNVTPSIRLNGTPATVYGTLPAIAYTVGNDKAWMCQAKISVPQNTTIAAAFYVLINGTSANLNVGGVASAIGVPT